ncbi:MAG: AMP-binding protein [Burkholderiaceae bacterium]|nr:AMP-binding protein [Burkholderiaceae bacterium]
MNISEWLVRNADRDPDGAAIHFEGDTISHGELLARVEAFACALATFGVRPGDRVGLFLENCPEFLIARWAAIRLGAAAAPMNVMFQAREAQYVLNNATPGVLVTQSSLLPLVEQIWPDCPHLSHLVVSGAEIHGAHSFAALESAYAGRSIALHDCVPDDLCDLYYTSGTTGRPKGVMCSHFNFESLLRYEQVIWDMGVSDHTMVALPLFHAKGLIIPCLLATYVGCPQTLLRRWDTRGVLELIERNKVTFFAGVPTMYAYLNAFDDVERYDLSSIRICRVGGAPMPVEMHRAFEKRTGAAIIEGWGCTGWTGTSNPLDGERSIGSIGKALGELHPSIRCEIRIVDETGEDVPAGEEGEVVIRGDQIPKGFWRMPNKTASDYREGWFHTGDIGRRDERGFIYLVGRKDDLIITSGFNVYPREVEEVLHAHPSVADVAVVGMADGDKGQSIKAFVVCKPGVAASETALVEYCRSKLAKYKAPRAVEFIDALPRTASGKVQRFLLTGGNAAPRS